MTVEDYNVLVKRLNTPLMWEFPDRIQRSDIHVWLTDPFPEIRSIDGAEWQRPRNWGVGGSCVCSHYAPRGCQWCSGKPSIQHSAGPMVTRDEGPWRDAATHWADYPIGCEVEDIDWAIVEEDRQAAVTDGFGLSLLEWAVAGERVHADIEEVRARIESATRPAWDEATFDNPGYYSQV